MNTKNTLKEIIRWIKEDAGVGDWIMREIGEQGIEVILEFLIEEESSWKQKLELQRWMFSPSMWDVFPSYKEAFDFTIEAIEKSKAKIRVIKEEIDSKAKAEGNSEAAYMEACTNGTKVSNWYYFMSNINDKRGRVFRLNKEDVPLFFYAE